MSTIIPIEDIKDANAHNSAMALTKSWANVFRKYALNETEELTDNPANSFNVFTHLTAQSAAKMMYEQAARINETNESTAILPKSLLNKLSANEIVGIFGTPSRTTVAFCLKKDDILENSVVVDSVTGLRRLVINKGMNVTYDSHPPFLLPYDVIINTKPVTLTYKDANGESYEETSYNIYAYYDMPSLENDGMRSIYEINNQYISSREIRYDGSVYVAFFFKMFQIERKEVKFYVSDPDTSDTVVSFPDNLVCVEVFRKPTGKDSTEHLMVGTTEGTINSSRDYYNYSYDYKRNKQNYNVIFNKTDNAKLLVGDEIRVVVYTTKGSEGNMEFPYMSYNLTSMSVNYDQDLGINTQNAMLNIVTLAFARDTAATGGKDQLSLEEIRSLIIEKKYSRGVLITDNEITNKAKSYGYECHKIRHDVINMYYRAFGKIIYKNMTLSTGTDTLSFDLSKKERLLPGYNYYMIEPSDVFRYNQNEQKFYYLPRYSTTGEETVETYDEYVKLYNESANPESVLEVSFPFYIRYDNTSNPKITVYDMDIKTNELLSFIKYNENYALDKIDIPYIGVQRNPYRGVTDGSFNEDIANNYYITFVVYTGENTLNKMYLQYQEQNSPINSDDSDNYNKQYITFNIDINGLITGEKYTIDPRLIKIINADTMVNDGFIAYQAVINTNNFVSENSQIQMKGIKRSSSIGSDYSTYYAMDTDIKFTVTGRFTDVGNTSTYNCITYESEKIQLVRYLTDFFGIDFDINTNKNKFEIYESIVPKTYKEQIYLLNPDYDPKIEDDNDPNHYEYQVVLNADGNIDFLPGIDENGNTLSIPNYKVNHNLGDPIFDYIEITDVERFDGPLETREYYIKVDELNDVYEKVEDLEKFDPEITYYRAELQILHNKGDFKIFDKKTGELLPDATDLSNTNTVLHTLEPKYIGMVKNVPWINRLYFSNADMYETIRDLYNNIIDDVSTIRNIMFDGGIIYMGLIRTSGRSTKYKAYRLSENTSEYINNIAVKLVFRVKFKSPDSVDYKKTEIINAAAKYINELESDLSIDGLFEKVKESVPDIQYINLIQLNNYYNGEVQTIIGDSENNDELLTVSQKTEIDSDGNITFVPDITVQVVNSEE